MRWLALFVPLLLVAPARAADEVEELLILKFKAQASGDIEKLRIFVNDAVAKAREAKEAHDPDRGIKILRDANDRIDAVKLLPPAERNGMLEAIQPAMAELRGVSLLKRRTKASFRLDVFRDYLELFAVESRYPGRSGPEDWEPALFWNTKGDARTAKLVRVSTNYVTRRFDVQQENILPPIAPIIQVFGGFYVYDRAQGHHMFFTNREFYESIWLRFVREYETADVPGKKRLTPAEMARPSDKRRLKATIDNGEYFLRGLPGLEPIPCAGVDESNFLEFVAQSLMHKGLPQQVERIYPLELTERLAGFSKMQMSATKRTLAILQAKEVAVSPLYAEILREEVTKVLKSEYSNFVDGEVNRAILYIFSKLK